MFSFRIPLLKVSKCKELSFGLNFLNPLPFGPNTKLPCTWITKFTKLVFKFPRVVKIHFMKILYQTLCFHIFGTYFHGQNPHKPIHMCSYFKAGQNLPKNSKTWNCDSKSYTKSNGVYFMYNPRFLDLVSSILRSIIIDSNPNLNNL